MKLFQAFLLSGGTNGRLTRGDALVEIEFFDGDSVDVSSQVRLEPPTLL